MTILCKKKKLKMVSSCIGITTFFSLLWCATRYCAFHLTLKCKCDYQMNHRRTKINILEFYRFVNLLAWIEFSFTYLSLKNEIQKWTNGPAFFFSFALTSWRQPTQIDFTHNKRNFLLNKNASFEHYLSEKTELDTIYVRPKEINKNGLSSSSSSSSSLNAAYVIATAASAATAIGKCVCASETAGWVERTASIDACKCVWFQRRALFTVCSAHGFNAVTKMRTLMKHFFVRCKNRMSSILFVWNEILRINFVRISIIAGEKNSHLHFTIVSRLYCSPHSQVQCVMT